MLGVAEAALAKFVVTESVEHAECGGGTVVGDPKMHSAPPWGVRKVEPSSRCQH